MEMDSLTLTAGSTALISALFIQMLKHAKWFPLLGITPDKQNINFAASIAVAAVASAGISYKFDYATDTLAITGVSHWILHWGIQWVVQHASYKTLIVPTELLAAIVNELKTLNVQK